MKGTSATKTQRQKGATAFGGAGTKKGFNRAVLEWYLRHIESALKQVYWNNEG